MNLKSVLENTASRYGDRDALIYGDQRLTYSELERESNRFAGALIASGIGKEDRIAMFLSNSLEFLIAFFGIVKIGAIAMPLDQQYKFDEMQCLLDHAKPAVVISESSALEVLSPHLSGFGSIRLIIAVGDDHEDRFTGFNDFCTSGSIEPVAYKPSPDDVASIMYTSSPSFKPRGVMLTHDSFVREAAMSVEGYHQTQDDIMIMFALPMFHVFGLVSAGLGSVYAGSTIVIVPGTGLSISSFMATVEREKGTMYLGVPFIFSLAVDMAEKGDLSYDLSSLRVCASAGAPLSPRIADKFSELCGKTLIDCYGLTEGVSHVTCPELGSLIKRGTVGKALSGWKLRIVDENGNDLPPGTSGEILVQGPVMKGYYNEPEATKETVKNGWLYTGDIGMLDEDGDLFITGRSKGTIIVKGQNIYPVDAETVISKHPDVEEVVVMGLPDAKRGEIVITVIHVREGTDVAESEIRQLISDHLVGYKAPRKIIFTGPMPRNASGEIDREQLRKDLSLPPVFPVP